MLDVAHGMQYTAFMEIGLSVSPVIGILGGMGPAATADFYAKLVRRTRAGRDQEHPRVVIWSDPTIPDRTEALLGGGEDPTPLMLRGIRHLEEAGATVIAVPCNTAHAFVPVLQAWTPVPILHMVERTVERLAARDVKAAGLLATSATCRIGLYQSFASEFGLEIITPDAGSQATVMEAIRLVKAGIIDGSVTDRLAEVSEVLLRHGAQAIIAGCTEIPLVLHQDVLGIPLIDPTSVLADAVLSAVGAAVRV